MFTGGARADPEPVLIHVRVEVTEPPCGLLWPDEGEPVAFSGWLDLLRVLSDLLASQPGAPPAAPRGS